MPMACGGGDSGLRPIGPTNSGTKNSGSDLFEYVVPAAVNSLRTPGLALDHENLPMSCTRVVHVILA